MHPVVKKEKNDRFLDIRYITRSRNITYVYSEALSII